MSSTEAEDGLDLFAVVPVSDFSAARPWYERLLGGPPAFLPHGSEAVWELAAHRYLVINEDRERAGGGVPTIFAADFDERVAAIAACGLEPAKAETYSNGVRKTTFRDADGNEVGFGGAPLDA